ncbi:class I adenylate-forming enzyme family protein [Actinomycetospora termitidis]|uniref:Class I adenylate-forming enzyme family protein n=1 Tax=Actinomycetospora termitidis TaxID=3053470 RepID=A0ABT7MGK1_9PSEU|nr:class I adenylate-forming enzyme family protein [Actinomycetospora sp. Odt1-22]MDL5159072.1 class I adenylate-forming enzyme family protein [Actinomycetospora sp. Odt1-22]
MSASLDVRALPEVHRRPVGRATIGDQLRRHAQTRAERVAVVSYADGVRRETTYGELDRQANAVAGHLLAAGLRRGDRVAVMARNSVEVIAVYYGALKAGAAFTGINVLHGRDEVAAQVDHAEPAVVVADPAYVELLDRVPTTGVVARIVLGAPAEGWTALASVLAGPDDEPEVDVDEHDLAMLIYTSGTESTPKGVMIPHRNYLISTAPAWSWGLRTGPDDTWFFAMPFFTIAGLGSMTTLTMMGATLVLPDSLDPARALDLIDAERVTVVAQTPTFYLALARADGFGPETVGTVRRAMTYGGQVSPAAVDAWSDAADGIVWGTYWGQSELSQLGSVGWFSRLEDIPDADPSWIGVPVTHLETRIVTPDGVDAAPGEPGELWCRSPSVMLGYFKEPERTAAVFTDDGWLRTGDIVRSDPAGNLFFADRAKDMIKSGGFNVSSQEVERVLHTHPDVLRAAVVGRPDEYWSEAVTAFVILQPGTSPDLVAYCRERLASYKTPKAVHVVDAFPVDGQGKVLKRELRRVDV